MENSRQERETSENRVKFNEAPEQEQIERFSRIKSLFANKTADARGDYYEFTQNTYKHADQFKIEGVSKADNQKLFEQARQGNEIINAALLYFQATKMNDGTKKMAENCQGWLDNLNRIIEEKGGTSKGEGFAQRKNKQLNVEKLTGCFKWSLDAFVHGGEKIGRTPPEGLSEEIDPLSEDLEAILEKVNQFR